MTILTSAPAPPVTSARTLGVRANWRQFAVLVAITAFVGAMVGVERSVLPILAEEKFGVASASAVLSFVAAFGVAKSLSNLAAGTLAHRVGRRRLLILGWLIGLPVAPLIVWAPAWGWVVAANVLLGINQGLTWSMTVVMKIDIAGPRQRGLAMGMNEASGYGAVAVAAWVGGVLAAGHGPRTAPFVVVGAAAAAGLALSLFTRDTADHVGTPDPTQPVDRASLRRVFARVSWRDRSLSAACQAGLVTNLNDGIAWGIFPLFLTARGLSIGEAAFVVGLYPATWGLAQLATGAWSDRVGRKTPIVLGMGTQAAGIAAMAWSDTYAGWIVAALTMGVGTALTYPTLIAYVGDRAAVSWRATAIGVYRLWRDLGFVAGALLAGIIADVVGVEEAILTVAAVTAASGLVAWLRMSEASVEINR